DNDYDSERDIFIFKDLPSSDTLSIPEIESFHFDIPLFSRPPAKPPDAFYYMPDDDSWKEHSFLGCSSVPFLSLLISSSMGESGQAQRPKTSASWEATHAYQYFRFFFLIGYATVCYVLVYVYGNPFVYSCLFCCD
nr:hypothetical protein [Tanacetum cinerariifolium]